MNARTRARKSVVCSPPAEIAGPRPLIAHHPNEQNAAREIPEPYEKALRMWLEWNEVHEQLTGKMFQAGNDMQAIQASMDEADRLRQQALDLSLQLLD